jgi:hypothetical protein
MKSRYSESFLFPNSQEDFRRPETFYSHQGLHGLDAVAPGYFETYPDVKKSFEDQLAFYEQYLIELKNSLANPGPYDIQGYTQFLIFNAETQIAYFKEQLRVETSLPNFNETVRKYVADLNVKAEAADVAANQALNFQAAADFFTQQGLLDSAEQNQLMADDYARVAAEQQTLYSEAQASTLDNIQKLSFTDYGLDTAAIRSAAEAAGAAAFFADPDVQRSLTLPDSSGGGTSLTLPDSSQSKGTNMDSITFLALDADQLGALLIYEDKTGTRKIARGAEIDALLKSYNATRAAIGKTSAYDLLQTQTTAVDPSTKNVQHVDTKSGTVSTGNAATGVVQVTTATGQTVTGTGAVTAGAVTTIANPASGTVTTINKSTGVTTTTSGSTGQTIQSVTAAAGGSGNLVIIGLLGLLLLRGAFK